MRIPPDTMRGFRAILPFWIAAAPIAFAYVLAAHDAGLTNGEIALMSLTVFSVPTQFALLQFIADGTALGTILLTVLVLNAPFILYGVSLAKHLRFTHLKTRVGKALAAFAFTDAAYSVTIASEQNRTLAFLLGAELSMYTAWNGFTLIAIFAGEIAAPLRDLPLRDLPLGALVPLIFFVLLMRVIKTGADTLVVIVSILSAAALTGIGLGDFAVIIVGLICPLIAIAQK